MPYKPSFPYSNETEKQKDDTSSIDDGSHGVTEQDDKNTGNEKDDGMET